MEMRLVSNNIYLCSVMRKVIRREVTAGGRFDFFPEFGIPLQYNTVICCNE